MVQILCLNDTTALTCGVIGWSDPYIGDCNGSDIMVDDSHPDTHLW
jgi:hypothetical protein